MSCSARMRSHSARGLEAKVAVARLVDAIGGGVAIHRVPAGIVHHAARLQRHHPLEERGAHVLAATGALANEERGQDGLAGKGGGVVVGHGDAHVLGRPAETLGGHDAAHGLEQGIEARPLLVGTVGAEGGDGGIDEARVDGAEVLVTHAQPVAYAGPHVLHRDVGAPGQAVDEGAPVRRFEIHRDRALAPVPAVEAGQLAKGVALQALHLDHVGSEVSQHHRRVGAGDVRGEIDNGDAGERAGSHEFATCLAISSRWYSASPNCTSSDLARLK